MKIDRRLILNFDWFFLFLVLIIASIGLMNIYSAGASLTDDSLRNLYLRQIIWLGVGFFLMVATFSIDYRFLVRFAYVFYGVTLIILILVFVVGFATRGSQRWIALGFFSFQPSELMKLSLILALAKYFDEHKIEKGYSLKDLWLPGLMVFVPLLFILKQPDLGTAIIIMIIFFTIIFMVGLKWRCLLVIFLVGLICLPTGWFFLKDYQRDRIIAFLNPQVDPLGSGYHIIQSIIAVGSGGLLGKGFLKGSQTQLKFLPEQQTDFIFSVFAEEWGFLGGLLLLCLFLVLILWGLKIAFQAKDRPGQIISLGVVAIIFSQFFINVGMVIGLLPVVGIPLPFMSYGGSSLVSLMIGMGLILNVRMRRFIFQ